MHTNFELGAEFRGATLMQLYVITFNYMEVFINGERYQCLPVQLLS